MLFTIVTIALVCVASLLLLNWLYGKKQELDGTFPNEPTVLAAVTAPAPLKRNVWVTPHKDLLNKKSKWAVKEEEKGEPASLHVTQAEAEKAGRALALEFKGELFILGRNGQIRKKNSYGNDPANVKG